MDETFYTKQTDVTTKLRQPHKKTISLNDGYTRLFACEAETDDEAALSSVREKGKRIVKSHNKDPPRVRGKA
jgi:hypothetical protein